ncbi:hypothetical protein FB45DRAFT_1051596 [Roridomyces roridus]|uniref:BTB domain-containing protein n=1 Tax=Roridomyces roridus TaxID=1738132 RepID=A0AAD7FWJ0_9AGAR|nr:hypothetical protein FB45DRAFT_1051596 [Roridomyces roridus]
MTTFKDAAPPFSRELTDPGLEAPDLILRSSDAIDFYTHRHFLVYVSPVFRDMFTFPAPTQLVEGVDLRDDIPVVQLAEPSDALRKLLLLCYPGALSQEPLSKLDGLYLVYRAADKYQVPGVKDAIIKALPNFVKGDAYRVYAFACGFGLAELAKVAALETLKDAFLPMNRQYTEPEFELVSGPALLRLHSFLFECRNAAVIAVQGEYLHVEPYDLEDKDGPWWTSTGHAQDCGAVFDAEIDFCAPARWYGEHMAAVGKVVDSHPNGDSAAKAVLDYSQSLHKISKCQVCSRDSAESLSRLAGYLQRRVDNYNQSKLAKWQFL